MPRQIIDTESSRPAYVRRNIFRLVAVVIIAIVLAVIVIEALRHGHVVSATGTIMIAAAPGNPFSGRVSWEARPRTPPQETPCCDA